MDSTGRTVRVLVATPLGRGGMGGIDRIMDAVRDRLAEEPPPGLDVQFAATRGQGSIAFSPLLVGRFVARSAGRVIGRGPDVIHINLSSHGSTMRKLVVARAARTLGIPYVIHLHGSGFRVYWDKASTRLSDAIREMFAHAACTLVLGKAWRDYILTRAPEVADRLTILPNATPAAPASERPHQSDRDVTILFLGHVGPRKGVPQLVEALGSLQGRPGWQAVIAGNGEVEATRAALLAQGLGERVTMPGWVGPADVTRLLSEADILVLPSLEENLPMSVIEGMAAGLAVVTTPVGATSDIIEDGRTGLLVPPGDAGALASAIGRLLDDAALCRELGASAKRFHNQQLEIGQYVRRLVGIWRSVAERRKVNPSSVT